MNAHLPALLLALPFFGAFAALGTGPKFPAFAKGIAILTTLTGLGLSLAAGAQCLSKVSWAYELGGWAAPWGLEIRLNAFTCLWAAVVFLITLLTLCLEGTPPSREPSAFGPFFPGLLLLLAGSLSALSMGQDSFDLYLWIQLALLAAAVLVAASSGVTTAFPFLLGGSLGASFFLLGALILYAGTGTLHLGDTLSQLLISKDFRLSATAGGLITLGLAFPLCFPTPVLFGRLLSRVPASLTAWLASLGPRAAALLLYVVYFSCLGDPDFRTPTWLSVLEQLTAAFFLTDLWYASRERNWLKAAAFLNVAPLGYVFIGFLLGTPQALQGAMLEIIHQSLCLAGFFYLAHWVREAAGTDEMAALEGSGKRHPLAAGVLIFLGMDLVGVPPLGGFFAKWYLWQAAFGQQRWFLALALGSAYAFSLFYLVIFSWRLFFPADLEERAKPASLHKGPQASLWAAALLAAAVLVLSLFNRPLVADGLAPTLPKAYQSWVPPLEPMSGKEVE